METRIIRFSIWATVVGMAAFFLYFALGLYLPTSRILTLGQEDGPVEYLAALFWAAASVVCVVRLVHGQRHARIPLLFWASFAFLCMGEEVSWFQRVVGFETPPTIEAVNVQGEFNLHNLGSVDLGPVANSQYAFMAGFFGYFFVLPLLQRQDRVRTLAERVGYTAPHRDFLVMIWTVIATSYSLQALGSSAAVRVIAESRETFYAFVVLANAYWYLRAPSLLALPRTRAASA